MVEYQNIGHQTYDLGSTMIDGFFNSQVLNDWFINQWLFWLAFFILAIVFGWFLSKTQQYSVFRR